MKLSPTETYLEQGTLGHDHPKQFEGMRQQRLNWRFIIKAFIVEKLYFINTSDEKIKGSFYFL